MARSTAQQAVIDTLEQGGNLLADDVHPMTLKALENEGIVEVSDGAVFLVNDVPTEITVESDPEEPQEVSVQALPTEEEVIATVAEASSGDVPMVENVVELGDDFKLRVKDGWVKIPAGTEVPLISFYEEQTRAGILKWLTCLHVPTGIQFLVNSRRNKSKIISPRPLTDFR